MSTEKGYNGWANYETWNVALWIDNDQGSYSQRQEMAEDAWKDAESSRTFTRLEQATLDLAKSLEAWIEELNPIADQASLFTDLLNAALGEVDWMEIAEHFMDDVDKDGCCSECGADLDDGEGYDGKCGECADVKEPDSDDAEVKS
jgi:hypothetical protein